MKKITSLFLISLFSTSLAFAAEDSTLKSVAVSYSANSVPTVVITNSDGTINNLPIINSNELAIMSEIATDYNMPIRDVSAVTKFKYSKLSRADQKLDLRTTTISTRTVFGKTVVIVKTKDGSVKDYWFNNSSSYKASRSVAKMHSISEKLVWKNVLRNK